MFLTAQNPENDTEVMVCSVCAKNICPVQAILLQFNAVTLRLQATTIGGTLLREFGPEDIPEWHEELLVVLAAELVTVPNTTSSTAVAADGRAYSLKDFQQYYGANYLDMWQMALMRSLNIVLIMQAQTVHNGNYSALLQAILPGHSFTKWQNAIHQVRLPGEKRYLVTRTAFQRFIPAHLWPYEPMLANSRPSGHSWMQIYMGNNDQMDGFYRTSFSVKLLSALDCPSARSLVDWGYDFPRRIIFAYRISCLDETGNSNNISGFLTAEASSKMHAALTAQHRATAPLVEILSQRKEILWALNSLWTPCIRDCTGKPVVKFFPNLSTDATSHHLLFPAGMIHQNTLEDEQENALLELRKKGQSPSPPPEIAVVKCRHCGAHVCAGNYLLKAKVLRHHATQCFSQSSTLGFGSLWDSVFLEIDAANNLGVLMNNADELSRTFVHGQMPFMLEVPDGTAWLDEKAMVSVIGQRTLVDFLALLRQYRNTGIGRIPYKTQHLWGDVNLTSNEVASLTVGLQGLHGLLRVHVIPGRWPLSLGMDFLCKHKASWQPYQFGTQTGNIELLMKTTPEALTTMRATIRLTHGLLFMNVQEFRDEAFPEPDHIAFLQKGNLFEPI